WSSTRYKSGGSTVDASLLDGYGAMIWQLL
ncbi:MAG: hypothetical protein ACI8RD_011034, partial [Bacillariaceae sp.]